MSLDRYFYLPGCSNFSRDSDNPNAAFAAWQSKVLQETEGKLRVPKKEEEQPANQKEKGKKSGKANQKCKKCAVHGIDTLRHNFGRKPGITCLFEDCQCPGCSEVEKLREDAKKRRERRLLANYGSLSKKFVQKMQKLAEISTSEVTGLIKQEIKEETTFDMKFETNAILNSFMIENVEEKPTIVQVEDGADFDSNEEDSWSEFNREQLKSSPSARYCKKCKGHGLFRSHRKFGPDFDPDCPFNECACDHCNYVNRKRIQDVEKMKRRKEDRQNKNGGTSLITVKKEEDDPDKKKKTPTKQTKRGCRKCKSHGISSRAHVNEEDAECPFETCECDRCWMVNRKRAQDGERSKKKKQKKCNKLITVKEEENKAPGRTLGRALQCRKCKSHGIISKVHAHEDKECPFKDCDCPGCVAVEKKLKAYKKCIAKKQKARSQKQEKFTKELGIKEELSD